ncbi:MAG: metallophosphoesterase [Armatimonadota bacterium]
MGQLIAGIVPAVRTLTLPGLLLAALAQVLCWIALRRRYGLEARGRRRLARAIVRADLVVLLAGLLIAKVAYHVNHGSYYWRGNVIVLQILLTSAAVLAIYTRAATRAVGKLSLLGGLVLTVATFVGLTAPGVRLSSFQRPAELTRTVVRLNDLPAELDGLTIALISDLHVSRNISVADMSARLRPLRKLRPDLVIFDGDLGTQGGNGMELGARVLGAMSPQGARLAVLGNHDQSLGAARSKAELTARGYRVLDNEGQLVRAGGGKLWVAGITNGYKKPGDIGRALEGAPNDTFILLLAHSPDVVLEPLAQRADLILSGHTHGGQVILPLTGPMAVSSRVGPRYAAGLHTIGVAKLFVTRGLGEVVTPFRILCEPEIAMLELRRAGR